MADHGPDYVRTVDPKTGSEIGKLGTDCGHHCGVVTVGGSHAHVGHCNCSECHNGVYVKE